MGKILLVIAFVALLAAGCNSQMSEVATETPTQKVSVPRSKFEMKIEADGVVGSTLPLNASHFTSVSVEPNPDGAFNLIVQLNKEGKRILSETTTANVGKQIAVYIDNQKISSPTVQAPLTDGTFVLSGNFTEQQAIDYKEKLQGYKEVKK